MGEKGKAQTLFCPHCIYSFGLKIIFYLPFFNRTSSTGGLLCDSDNEAWRKVGFIINAKTYYTFMVHKTLC